MKDDIYFIYSEIVSSTTKDFKSFKKANAFKTFFIHIVINLCSNVSIAPMFSLNNFYPSLGLTSPFEDG